MDSGLEKIVDDSVGANTFRAFHHMRQKPSEVFREWAIKALNIRRLQSLRCVRSQKQYIEWLHELQVNFQLFWKAKMRKEIAFGPSLKLPNLLMKQLCLWSGIGESDYKTIVGYLHVPLDVYTIQAIANCVDASAAKTDIGRIPKSAAMKFVENRKMYEALQEVIRGVAKKAKVAPIALDCWREEFLRDDKE